LRDLVIPLPADLAVQRDLVNAWQRANNQRRQDSEDARRTLRDVDALVVAALGMPMPTAIDRAVYGVPLWAVRAEQRLNPAYFHPERQAALAALTTLHPPNRVRELSQVADFIRESVRVEGGGYLGLAQVESDTGELTTDQPSDDEAGLSFTFQVDDVLFARLRPYLNKVHRAERAGLCSTEFHVIRIRPAHRPEDSILPDYLAMVFRSSVTLAQTRHMITGNTHPRLANDDVVRLRVPIPPVDIQNSLVRQLHERRQQARSMLAAAETSWQAAQQAFQAALFENPA
jgi:type I restriction enzyme, S subunit